VWRVLGRFRVNVFRNRGNVGLVLRRHSHQIRALGRTLSAEQLWNRFAKCPEAIVLVTGVTGSGKSTTLAAMLDRVNLYTRGTIITIEDPIEFCLATRTGYVNQREIGVDTPRSVHGSQSLPSSGPGRDSGRRNARCGKRLTTALHAAETAPHGCSRLCTPLDVLQQSHRISACFRRPSRSRCGLQLAATLRAVVSQRLVRRCDAEGRVPAVEVMINTAYNPRVYFGCPDTRPRSIRASDCGGYFAVRDAGRLIIAVGFVSRLG